MVWLIIGVILYIIAFIILGFQFNFEYGDVDGWKLCPKQLFSLLILIVSIFLSCIKTVHTGSTGIVTTFGKVEPVTLDAGIHFMAPWKKVIRMDNRVQKAQVELSCFSSDIQEVNVIYTINYQIDKVNAQELYRTIGTDYYETVIVPRVQECVKAQFAKYTAESLISDRNTVAIAIEDDLRNSLAKYNIELGDTAIENIDFSDEFTNAAEAKVTAQQKQLTAKTEQETANIEAQAAAERQVIQAQADADAALIAANNDAEIAKVAADSAEYQGQKQSAIMNKIGEALDNHPDLINYYKIDNWDGKLPTTMLDSGANLFINK